MYIEIIVKIILTYFFILLIYKLIGNKEIENFNVFNLIVLFLIVNLSTVCIYTKDIFVNVVAIIVIIIIQLIINFINFKNKKLKTILEGKTSVIINNGKINFKEMIKNKYTIEDLIIMLRENDIKSVEEVLYAVLEKNGKISVYKKKENYPMPLILDGKIVFTSLTDIGKDEMWLYKLIKERNVKLDDIFYAFYKGNETYIIKKS